MAPSSPPRRVATGASAPIAWCACARPRGCATTSSSRRPPSRWYSPSSSASRSSRRRCGTCMRSSRFRAARLALALLGLAAACAFARVDVDSLWEYSDPAASEARFRAELATAKGDDRLELLTQVARTYSLRNRFMEAHRILDDVQPRLAHAGPRPRIRYLLERGLTFISDGAPERARPFFLEAFERARKAKEAGLAVDAAHMVAITWSGTPRGLAWNRRGLAIARWSVAHCLRALGREADALAILVPLAAQPQGESLRGDILEELALDTQALAGIARVRH